METDNIETRTFRNAQKQLEIGLKSSSVTSDSLKTVWFTYPPPLPIYFSISYLALSWLRQPWEPSVLGREVCNKIHEISPLRLQTADSDSAPEAWVLCDMTAVTYIRTMEGREQEEENRAMFAEHLLCPRHCSRCWVSKGVRCCLSPE